MARHERQLVPLAVVGMACRLPGGETLDEFWSLLREGRSAFSVLPADRLNRELHFSPERGQFARTYCEILGQVSQRPIDPAIIEIPDELAARYDMTHLTMCEVAASACRHAGYDPLRLPARKTGVYLGNSSVGDLEGDVTFALHADQLAHRLLRTPAVQSLSPGDQMRLVREAAAAIRTAVPAAGHSRVDSFAAHSAAGLITGLFGLTGPSLATDSACAASFTAMLLAAHALQLGEVDMAIVGAGACRSWCELIFLSIVQAMSGNGSRPFDADADGLIAADGYGAVVLKTLPRALADGDRIVGVIRGVGMSSDGKGKGFWAPREEGQQECMRRAYDWGADPARVQYIHAHATSTQLGDATEMTSLAAVFGSLLPQKIPITSVKANIGHTLETAGMAGLIATLLSMQHRMIPPAANVQNLNPEIPWDSIPFFVPREPLDWPEPADGCPRRAAIDAFGIGGLNTHLVVDDRPETSPRGFAPAPSVLASSEAKSEKSPIAIIGLGCVLPGAHSIPEFLALLASDRDCQTTAPVERWNPAAESTGGKLAGRGSFLTDYAFNWKKHRIPPFQVANANPLQFALLDAADQAMHDSGYDARPFDRARATTLVGSALTNDFCNDVHLGLRLPDAFAAITPALQATGLGDDELSQVRESYQREFLRDKPGMLDETGSYSSSTLASRVAKQLDLGGGAMTIDSGDASGLAAIASAADLLRGGQCDLVVCAAGQRNMDLVRYRQLERQGLLDQFVPAEGAVAFLLKRLDDAVRDGDTIRAVIRGVACASDGKSPAGALRAATVEARSNCGSGGTTFSLVEPLACESVDSSSRHMSDDDIAARPAPLTTRLGHLQGGSGMLSLLRAVLSLEQGRVLGASDDAALLFAAEGIDVGRASVSAAMNGGFPTANGAAVWQLIVEGTTRLPPRHVRPAPIPDVGLSEDFEQLVLQAAFEQSGIPCTLLQFGDDLANDLKLDPGQQSELFSTVAARTGRPAADFGSTRRESSPRTLQDVVNCLRQV